MTGNQLQKLLDDGGLSQRGAAREIGIGERTMRRYIADEQPIPRATVFALRWLIHANAKRLDVDTGLRAKK